MKTIIMPKLGLTMEEGTLIRWFKLEGEAVTKGEVLFEVETDKSTNEVEAADSGMLGKVLLKEGETAKVLGVIGYLLEAGEKPPHTWPEPEAEPAVVAGKTQSMGMVSVTPSETTIIPTLSSRNVSPRARRLADEKGIDLEAVPGTGPGGRIVERDVMEYIRSHSLLIPTRLQQITAERMALSFTSTPHFYLKVDLDASQLVQKRQALLPVLEQTSGVRLTYTDLILFLVARTLRDHPRLNAAWENGRIRLYRDIHIALAIEVKDGLVAPVLRNSDQKTIQELARERQRLVLCAGQSQLSLDNLEGGTFTLSNLGMYGVDEFTAIINPPQSAILAVGRIQDQVVPVNGQIGIKPRMRLTLSVDHRVVDGVQAARFLSDLKIALEAPSLQEV